IGISLRALGLVEGGRTGERLLREAVDVLAHSPARLEYARALVDLGAARRRGNSRSEARQLLRQGVELAHRCGASALVKRADEGRRGTGPPLLRAVTPRQRVSTGFPETSGVGLGSPRARSAATETHDRRVKSQPRHQRGNLMSHAARRELAYRNQNGLEVTL